MSTTESDPDAATEQIENQEQGVHSDQITEYEVQRFASLSGDTQELHLDEDKAKESIFDGRVVHGMHPLTFVSAALGQLDGTIILLGLDVDFDAPTRIGDDVTAHAVVDEQLNDEPEILRCRVTAETQDGTEVITGTATVRRD